MLKKLMVIASIVFAFANTSLWANYGWGNASANNSASCTSKYTEAQAHLREYYTYYRYSDYQKYLSVIRTYYQCICTTSQKDCEIYKRISDRYLDYYKTYGYACYAYYYRYYLALYTQCEDNQNNNPDATAPIITLKGEHPTSVNVGTPYTDAGAIALDDVDGNVTDKIVVDNPVDSSKVGTYKVTYTVEDKAGNKATAERTVRVNKKDDALILKSLELSTQKSLYYLEKEIYKNVYASNKIESIKVIGTYSNGDTEEVTDRVTWKKSANTINFDDDSFSASIGKATISASLDGISSNEITLEIKNINKSIEVDIKNKKNKNRNQRGSAIDITLMKNFTLDVKLKLTLKESDKVRFKTSDGKGTLTKEVLFDASINNALRHLQTIIVVDYDKKSNNKEPYTIETEVFESDDPNYENINPEDIVVTPVTTVALIEPPITQRRGAIRGVQIHFRVTSKNLGLDYELINPPKGMELVGRSDLGEYQTEYLDGVDIKWKVPMDIEEKVYTITVKGKYKDGVEGEISFLIKVPKSNIIESEVVNNELIITDKSSTLYGMKMKGHSGEDISKLKIRSVAYADVWQHKVKNKAPEDVVTQTVFVLDNMSDKLDVKFPEYIDTLEKRTKVYLRSYRFTEILTIDYNAWDRAAVASYLYEGTDGYVYSRVYDETNEGSKIFMIQCQQSQNGGC